MTAPRQWRESTTSPAALAAANTACWLGAGQAAAAAKRRGRPRRWGWARRSRPRQRRWPGRTR
eukprot:13024107-Alexandrium_andersonii.AAC.1